MKNLLLLVLLCTATATTYAQKDTRWIKGLYFQWGYNVDAYTRSTVHFKMNNGDNFVLHHARAHDSGDFDAIYKEPVEISIPQYNYRIGFYLNNKYDKAIEINFDHTKYILSDGQTVRVTGIIDGKPVDGDSILDRNRFLHFEHSDGANWLHINYVRLYTVLMNRTKTHPVLRYVWKGGAGINIPRTDFTWHGDRLNNNFHVAGYNISAEGGARFYMSKKFFLEGTAKTGFVKYINALANTTTTKGNRATHYFGYIEGILTIGLDVHL